MQSVFSMASLDMSLDDIIKSNRSASRGRRQGKAQRGRGGSLNGGKKKEVPRGGGGRMTGVPLRGGRSLRVNTAVPSANTISKAS